MPLTIKCPKCARALDVPDEAAGKMVRCPACQETFALAQQVETPPATVTRAQPIPPAAWDHNTVADRRRREEEEEAEERRRRREREDDEPFRAADLDLRESGMPHRGGTILTLGILALCFFCMPLLSWILGGIAISMANNDLLQMARRQMDASGRSTTQTGKTLATIGVTLTTLWFLLVCFMRVSSMR